MISQRQLLAGIQANAPVITNAVLFQATWFACVIGGAAEQPVWGYLGVAALGVHSWSAGLIQQDLRLLAALGLGLPYARVALGSTGAALLPMLPINALGTVGPLEAGWTFGFVAMGLEQADASASGFLMHTVVIIVYLLAAGWAALRIGPAGLDAFAAWRQARAQGAAPTGAEPLIKGEGAHGG